jgi:hypothetical protein
MRLQYEVGDRICYYTTDSYFLNIPPKQVGQIASHYYLIKSLLIPVPHTVVTNNKDKVIGLLEGYSLFPFTKDAVSKDPGCNNIE